MLSYTGFISIIFHNIFIFFTAKNRVKRIGRTGSARGIATANVLDITGDNFPLNFCTLILLYFCTIFTMPVQSLNLTVPITMCKGCTSRVDINSVSNHFSQNTTISYVYIQVNIL